MRTPFPTKMVLSRPAPKRLIPLVSDKVFPSHIAEPAGTRTVSPLAAEETAAETSEKEALAVVIVAALDLARRRIEQSIASVIGFTREYNGFDGFRIAFKNRLTR